MRYHAVRRPIEGRAVYMDRVVAVSPKHDPGPEGGALMWDVGGRGVAAVVWASDSHIGLGQDLLNRERARRIAQLCNEGRYDEAEAQGAYLSPREIAFGLGECERLGGAP